MLLTAAEDIPTFEPELMGRNSLPLLAPLLVLKFGSSVLRDVADLPRVAGEIYRQRRKGFSVLVVVSALKGETDRLLAEAAEVGDGVNFAGIADLVSLGEARTAALLRIACDRIGLEAVVCQPEGMGLRTVGPKNGSLPAAIDPSFLLGKLARTGLAIVPGFVGIDADGGRALLERGGSDFSAIYLGGELGAAAVRLYKDTDGVFEADPKLDPAARRFDEISWQDALVVARPLIQPQAIEYAAARHLPIEVEGVGSSRPTRVAHRTGVARHNFPEAAIRVAMAGFGVVGQAVARRLSSDPRFDIVSILVAEEGKRRAYPAPVSVTGDAETFLQHGASVVIDVMSCPRTSDAICSSSLAAGAHVVTASKQMVSNWILAKRNPHSERRNSFACSAAVGGSTPMLETLGRVEGVTEIWGIVNGTVNFVLTALADGHTLANALREARDAGFAEADATSDLSGADATAKLRIMADRAFPGMPMEVNAETLDWPAADRIRRSGERWVQVARLGLADGVLRGVVELVPLAELPVDELPDREWNCLFVATRGGGTMSCVGRGAGGPATAEAIIADLHDFADRQSEIIR